MAKAPKTTKKEKTEAPADMSKISDISKALREFRFGAAGAKAKNTALPKMMRKARAKLITAQRMGRTLANEAKKA